MSDYRVRYPKGTLLLYGAAGDFDAVIPGDKLLPLLRDFCRVAVEAGVEGVRQADWKTDVSYKKGYWVPLETEPETCGQPGCRVCSGEVTDDD